MTNKSLLKLTVAASILNIAAAHGYVQGVVADGVWYQGYRPSFQYLSTQPVIPSWSDPKNIDNGYVNNYNSPDIICHLSATPGKTAAPVKAGGTVELQWTDWPIGHLGPVITYLANCNGDCKDVDKTKLLFNKIDAVGLVKAGSSAGVWGASELIANNNSWTLQIPSDIAPGNYVLRHEIIALQEAMAANSAQNYPQCVNLFITGSGSNSLQTGTLGTDLYTANEPGLHVDIYSGLSNYTIPGPPLYSGAIKSTQPTINSTSITVTSFGSASTSSGASASFAFGSTTSTSGFVTSTTRSTSSSASGSGLGFYTASSTASSSSSTILSSVNSSSTTSSSSSSSTSTITSTSSSASSTSAMISSFTYSTITTAVSMTTLQTVTSFNGSSSNTSETASTTTTLLTITVSVGGNFADTPTVPTPTFSTYYPFTNGTSWNGTSWNGTVSAWSTGTGASWPTGTVSLNGTSWNNWIAATTTPTPIDNGYKPRRNARFAGPRK